MPKPPRTAQIVSREAAAWAASHEATPFDFFEGLVKQRPHDAERGGTIPAGVTTETVRLVIGRLLAAIDNWPGAA